MNPFVQRYHQTKGTHCWYCEREFNGTTVKRTREHIVPASRLIQNHPKNYVAACKYCNSIKGSRDAKEFAIRISNRYLNNKEHKMSSFFKIMMIRSWKLYNKTSKLHKIFYK